MYDKTWRRCHGAHSATLRFSHCFTSEPSPAQRPCCLPIVSVPLSPEFPFSSSAEMRWDHASTTPLDVRRMHTAGTLGVEQIVWSSTPSVSGMSACLEQPTRQKPSPRLGCFQNYHVKNQFKRPPLLRIEGGLSHGTCHPSTRNKDCALVEAGPPKEEPVVASDRTVARRPNCWVSWPGPESQGPLR